MAKLEIKVASTSQTVNLFLQDSSSSTGAGLPGLVFNSAGLTCYYALSRAAAVPVTLATLAAITSAYSSGGFKEIDATNMPGWYRFDIPDAALASGRFVGFYFKGATNLAPLPLEIELTGWDNQDAVRGGLSALPNAAAGATNGLSCKVVHGGTAQVGAAGSITLAAGASATNDLYKGLRVSITSGTGAGQTRAITGYVGATKVASVDWNWTTTPDNTSIYEVVGEQMSPLDSNLKVRGVLLTDTATNVTNDVGITQTGADKVWASAARTLTSFGTLAADVWASATRTLTAFAFSVTVGTNNDKTDYGLASNAVDAAQFTQAAADKVWASAARTLTSFGTLVADVTTAVWANAARTLTSFGTLVADIETAVWSAGARTLTAFGFSVTVGANSDKTGYRLSGIGVDDVWDEAIAGHLTAGSTGESLSSAGSAGDPWATSLPGAYGAGTAGKIVGDNINATISSRSTLTAADVWTYVTRTLTQLISAVSPPPVVSGSSIALKRGETWTIPVTDLGSLVGATKIWFTIKEQWSDTDPESLVMVELTGGLVWINGTAATPSDGTLTVNDVNAGDLTIVVKPAATTLLTPSNNLVWDIQTYTAGVVHTLTEGEARISGDVTRAIS